MTNREIIVETRRKLDRAIVVRKQRFLEYLAAQRQTRAVPKPPWTEDQFRAQAVMQGAKRKVDLADKRIASAATFLRYLETKK